MGVLEGRTAIVTGAASGIGRATAKLFAAEGALVYAADLTPAIDTLPGEAAGPGRIVARKLDAGDETAVSALVDEAFAASGRLDAMYANAGITGPQRPILDLSAADWADVLRINLVGAFCGVKHAARVMVPQKRGSIICTASVAGLRSGAGATPYSASKAGVISLVQTAANQLAGTGVRVNAVCPGLIETGMTKPMFDYARSRGSEAKLGQLNPMRRYGVPEEIGRTVLFLASDAASYVNGQAIAVDGGLSSSHPVVPGKLS